MMSKKIDRTGAEGNVKDLGRRLLNYGHFFGKEGFEGNLRPFLEDVPVGLYIIRDGRFIFVNSCLLNLLGYAGPVDLIGKSFSEAIPIEVQKTINSKKETEEASTSLPANIFRICKRDGSSIWVRREEKAAVYAGAPVHVGYLIDVTPFQEIEKSLEDALKRYRITLNEVEDSVGEVDLSGTITFANDAGCRIWGHTREEAIGTNYRSYVDEETAKRVYEAYNKVFRTGIPGKNIEYEIRRKDDGRRRIVEDYVTLIRNAEGKITGFRTVARDITDRKHTERELIEHRSRLEAIFRSVKDAIITVNTELRVTEANTSVESICGIPQKNITGERFPACLNQCSRSCYEVLRQTLEKKITVKEYRIECGHQQRGAQTVNVTSSPLLDSEGKFLGAVLVIRDVTLLSDLEKELRDRHQFQSIIGRSKKMQDIYRMVEDLANLETTVLLTGESGTGKELVAKALHYSGKRAFKPLISVNCSALTESLLESELFGHVRGAFTGAVRDKQGRFQAANRGRSCWTKSGIFRRSSS